MSTLISVCIPAYNAPDLLEKTLDSICDQNYEFLEIIISDDNSPIPLLSVFEKYKVNYPKYKWMYKYHEKNLGVLYNKKWLLENASGELVSFFEHDDLLIDKNHFLNVSNIHKNNSNIIIYLTNALLSYQHRKIYLNGPHSFFMKNTPSVMKGDKILRRMLTLSYFFNMNFSWSSIVFSKKAALSVGAFSKSYVTNAQVAEKIDAYHNEENMVFVMLMLENNLTYFSLDPSTIRTISNRGFSASPTHPRINMKNNIEFFNLWRGSELAEFKITKYRMKIRAIKIGIRTFDSEIYKYIGQTFRNLPLILIALLYGNFLGPLRGRRQKIYGKVNSAFYYMLNDKKRIINFYIRGNNR